MSRVAHVVTVTAVDAPAVHAARLRGLREAGWDAQLLGKGKQWREDPALRTADLERHIELVKAGEHYLPPRSLLRRAANLVRSRGAPGKPGPLARRPFDQRLRELRPDLVHFHSGTAGWKGLRLKEPLRCRVVVSFRDDGQDLEVEDLQWLWDAADLLIFPDAPSLERAAARGCPLRKAAVLEAPALDPEPRSDGRRCNGSLRLLSAGPLEWQRGFEHSLHAVRLLLDRGVGCQYRIVGRGHHLYPVSFARHQLGLADHVELAVPNGPIADEMSAADVLVDPAVTHTTSRAPIDAARVAGIPFVATARPGLPDGAGIVVPRRDPRAMANALATLAADSGLRRRLGRAGGPAMPRPMLEEHVRRLGDLYQRALT